MKDISQKQHDPRQRQMDLRRAYITARFTPSTLPAFFTLGDQLDYGGFDNRALESGQEYVFFILAELNSTTGVRGCSWASGFVAMFMLMCPLRFSMKFAITLAFLYYYIVLNVSRYKEMSLIFLRLNLKQHSVGHIEWTR